MKKTRAKIQLKLFLGNKRVLQTTRHKKTQILNFLKRVKHDRSYVKVTYRCGGHNDSTHTCDAALIKALTAYLEPDLVTLLSREEER